MEVLNTKYTAGIEGYIVKMKGIEWSSEQALLECLKVKLRSNKEYQKCNQLN